MPVKKILLQQAFETIHFKKGKIAAFLATL